MTTTSTVDRDWIPSTNRFAARLALVRHQMGWNLREAAVECGLAINAWARFEEGSSPRNLVDVVQKISTRTGVDRVWLMFGERPEQDSNLQPTDYKPVLHPQNTGRPPGRRDPRRPRGRS